MKFVVSSTELLSHLTVVSRVISSKNTLPILDNFLFNLDGNDLEITASDLETTLTTKIRLENVTNGGQVAIPYRILVDTLKEFPEQPLTFDINVQNFAIRVSTDTGEFNIVGQPAEDFPAKAVVKDEAKVSVRLPAHALLSGITKTIFATADDEMRPVMNGILFELSDEALTFVASDAHKLVRYKRLDVKSDQSKSFILPKKPASLLKNILVRETSDVMVEFDEKNALFTLENYTLVCRLVEGVYPNYSSVIPANNPNQLTIDRLDFYNSLRRVAPFTNQASNLVKISLSGNQIEVSAQDLDFSISAFERLKCQYEGDEMEIGFKSVFLIEILANISSGDIILSLSDPSRAGLLFPAINENENEDVLMLLMPMMVGA
ncbi:MAG: DNA polymerase III subunit beta [Bacteroidales bacterium]|jgi:DNA polymerase-3 subunit beta|nr:DNA polymerase III subunit beta [Bacteroidales bacterium]MDD4383946.1 DNA polymerase III subunit beta [Bacteroidales bacterium]MDY0196351.1 DNA polymerase III subunit beta [Tenuifilaceae bacterium]